MQEYLLRPALGLDSGKSSTTAKSGTITPMKELIKHVEKIKKDLGDAKSLLDPIYSDNEKKASLVMKYLEPFAGEKKGLVLRTKSFNISNAWIKAYELIYNFSKFKIAPSCEKAKTIVHYDNASFPGSFIVAFHHYFATMQSHLKYEWYASSLIEKNQADAAPLEDQYELYKNYKSRYTMTDANNGDVLKYANLMDIKKRFENKVDIYTSDLGFDVSKDYNKQELFQMPFNMAQVLWGLLILKPGGLLITKQYMFFEDFTISFHAYMTMFFEEVKIKKPVSSKEDNSETYLWCDGLIKNKYYDEFVEKALDMIKRAESDSAMGGGEMDTKSTNKTTSMKDSMSTEETVSTGGGELYEKFDKPFMDKKEYTENFNRDIAEASISIYTRQIKKIVSNVYIYSEIDDLGFLQSGELVEKVIEKTRSEHAIILDAFYKEYKFMPVDREKRLIMKDAFWQLQVLHGDRSHGHHSQHNRHSTHGHRSTHGNHLSHKPYHGQHAAR